MSETVIERSDEVSSSGRKRSSSTAEPAVVKIFGVRHHGPGCARSLEPALAEFGPDSVLIEGPAESDDLLSVVGRAETKPPIALLVFETDRPSTAAFYPFAEYSPEWRAILFGVERGIETKFFDLPFSRRLPRPNTPAGDADRWADQDQLDRDSSSQPSDQADAADAAETADQTMGSVSPDLPQDDLGAPPIDPIGTLAALDGCDDPDQWWEIKIEQRPAACDLFDALFEALSALRSSAPESSGLERLREAWMRQSIVAAEKRGRRRIAVVCGAWHAPALVDHRGSAKKDAEILKGLAKRKTSATWIPWTNGRLSLRSGYGAGVHSPGWYEILWNRNDRTADQWIARAASIMRASDLDASSASVIEGVRLAETLAAIRGLSRPGLREMNEAILSTLCGGKTEPTALIRRRLEIGDRMGELPDDLPATPLEQDIRSTQTRLRLKPSAEKKTLVVDLRNQTDRERSRLLHRLALINVEWGVLADRGSTKSTFAEQWRLDWRPELVASIIEASVWGHTLATAADSITRRDADRSNDAVELAGLLRRIIDAGLPETLRHVAERIDVVCAVAADVGALIETYVELADVARYADVRETPTDWLERILPTLFERAAVGLHDACVGVDDESAERWSDRLRLMGAAIERRNRSEELARWIEVIDRLRRSTSIPPRIRGCAARSAINDGRLTGVELATVASFNLAPSQAIERSAQWLGGLLSGGAASLIPHDSIWRALDRRLIELSPEAFREMLPAFRKSFADFTPADRRAMTSKIKRIFSDDRSIGGSPGRSSRPEGVFLSIEVDHLSRHQIEPLRQIFKVLLSDLG
jgi:hypothetical protein